jgi:arginyl-tRNA synthetase
VTIWESLIGESKRHMNDVFACLGVQLSDADIRGESFYNPELPNVVADLRALGLLVESEGAQVVFPEGYKDREGEPLPMIVQKSDGGFGYAATDLAAARFRVGELGGTRLIYVVDSRQSDHFGMLFRVLRASGFAPQAVRLDYVPFGTILGADKKPFKTRAGGTVRLMDVLNEAVERASSTVQEKNPELDADGVRAIARAVGVGAVKYADLSSDRIKDYVFDWDRMLSLEGNTAPYLQYAYARIQSMFRKGEVEAESLRGALIALDAPEERALVILAAQFESAVEQLSTSLEPHRLTGYLYELASALHRFYKECKVLKAEPEARQSRLALSLLVASILRKGLELLGIDVVDRM